MSDASTRSREDRETLFEAVFRDSPIAVAVTRRFEILFVNAALVTMFGFPGATVLEGMSAIDLIAPESRAMVERNTAGRIAGTITGNTDYEVTLLRADGTSFPGRLVVGTVEMRGEMLTVTHITDVTDAARREDALRQSERKFSTAFRTSPDAVNINRLRDGLYLDCNQGFLDLLGYERDEVVGKTSAELSIWNDPADRQRLVEGLSSTGLVESLEADFRAKSGTIVRALMSARVVELDGEPCILSVTRDLTERLRADAAIRESENRYRLLSAQLEERVAMRTSELAQTVADLAAANDELAAAAAAKSEFLASMSHELRTPLNSIIGFSGALLQGLAGEMNPEQSRQLGMVYTSGKHLLELINQVLEFSRIEGGQMPLHIETVDLASVVARVLGTIEPLASQGGLELVVDMDECADPRIRSDAVRLEQILLNLLGNAVKFSDGGSVELAVRCDGLCAEFAVTDSGIGIPPEALPHVFEDFFQAPDARAGKHEGTGLGLAVSRRLAEALSGSLTAVSEPGVGSTFTLIVPTLAAEGTPAPPT